ncbi:5-(carboxyamino)imidazole ribonucleotide synthase [Rothia nasimurium]|uniref:N5-carboxyaminoimidazole ribonucleotide synthase n=1 Tax=Rothia nasimurium TaxID=85336 RepID=A0A1Y1RMS7_9MICC|nr:5-(carboxyamino)imidazole ribonucleotide synthase [Rothia nasimurium]ORC15428.1 5-(carboxyamino)imidazole ribonucleotide synthase [Rothia nasimurium]
MTGPKIGVVGGGQLARMMAPAATELGFDVRILAESEDSCARQAVPLAPVGDYRDFETLAAFAREVDVLTFDHEHVPTDFLRRLLAEGVNVQPRPDALVYAQDKIEMRKAVDRLGLPNPRWSQVRTLGELLDFGAEIGWPVVLKTPRGGYDGKGVLVLVDEQDARTRSASWFEQLPTRTDFSALLAEEKVPFTRELSAQVARRDSGEVRPWPVVESIQVNSVCDEVLAPAPGLSPQVAQAAQQAAVHIATELGVTGVMAAELFEVPDSETGFLVNELAMRPHNSGHWTQDGSVTSQFEQHLRAVANYPLGSTDLKGEVALMKNFLGGSNQDIFGVYPALMQAYPAAKVHYYGKAVKTGRKIGHINMTGEAANLQELRRQTTAAAALLTNGPA